MECHPRRSGERADRLTRLGGLAFTVVYAALIGWLFSRQPQTVAQITGGLAATIGAYSVDEQSFADGLRFFRNDQFVEARMAFARADPAVRDARTQFYIAYSYYRQGWGRLYHDDALYAEGAGGDRPRDRACARWTAGRRRREPADAHRRGAESRARGRPAARSVGLQPDARLPGAEMTGALREALVLPAAFLTVLLLGSVRMSQATSLVPPSVFALVLGLLWSCGSSCRAERSRRSGCWRRRGPRWPT